MTPEQDNSHASWSDSNAVSWDNDSSLMDIDDPSTPPLEKDQYNQPPDTTSAPSDDDEWGKPAFFSRDSLRQVARQFSPVLVPLPFAILIFLFTLPADLKNQSHISAIPMAILLLALVVIQGTFLYYAGTNDSLWTLYTIVGYAVFLLVGAFALFGLGGALFLFLVLLVIGLILGGRAMRQVPEGYVDLVFSFSKYSRTLSPGLNFILPWEKVNGRLSTKETTWTTPTLKVNVSRDQDVEIVATLTYELVPEDAHIAVVNMNDWEESLHEHFTGNIKSVVKELSPADFVAWSHHVHSRGAAAEAFGDPTTITRWDRLNELLKRRLQDQMAMRGILINLVNIQDITLIPHLTGVSGPPPGLLAQSVAVGGNMAMDTGRIRGMPPVQPRPVTAPAVAAVPPAAAAMSTPVGPAVAAQAEAPMPNVGVPNPAMFETMIEMYNSVREGRITDPATILGLATRFNAVARDSEASQIFNYDSARAASNLFQRAQALKAVESHRGSDNEVTVEMQRSSRHPLNENLAAGG